MGGLDCVVKVGSEREKGGPPRQQRDPDRRLSAFSCRARSPAIGEPSPRIISS